MDGEKKMGKSFGVFRIVGEVNGERKETLGSKF
jgi:hypothetical protein